MMTKNILISLIAAAFLISGCSEHKKEEKAEVKTEKSTFSKAAESVKEESQKALQATKEATSNVAQKAKETANKAAEATKNAVENTKEAAKEAAQKTKEMAKNAMQSVSSTAAAAKESVKEAVTPSANGEQIFTKCAGCHGSKAEKKALGKSQVIAGWPVEKIEKALNGYKNGSYGGSMKGIMQGQVKNLSEAEIKAVAEYISKL